MKAIKQIIDYLRERDELTAAQLAELASLGLCSWDEVYREEPEEETQPCLTRPEPDEEFPTLKLRNSKRRPRKAIGLPAKELCRRLADVFARAKANLAGVVPLARRLGPCVNWHEAAVVLRNAAVSQIEQALEESLRTRSLSLKQLWNFLAEERFRGVLADSPLKNVSEHRRRRFPGNVSGIQQPGPAGAVLTAADAADLGRHAALLQYEEIQNVFNLRMAQRQLVRAWAALYARRRDFIGRVLLREHHWLAYWSMVILYTARRGRPGNRPQPTDRENWPQRPCPEADHLMRAWTHALFMDRLAVLPLLQEYGQRCVDPQKACLKVRDAWFAALDVTDRSVLLARPVAVHSRLRHEFNRAGVFYFPTKVGSGDAWFLADFVPSLRDRDGGSRYVERWSRNPSYERFCFLCPRNWDRQRDGLIA